MKKILKFLKCKDIDEVVTKIRSYEVSEELEEFKSLMTTITRGDIEKKDLTTVRGKRDLIHYLRNDIAFKNTEEFKAIYLSANNEVITSETLFKGTVDRSVVYPRLIIERALKYHTKGIIFAHNHPSGNIEPSRKDKDLTLKMQELLEKIDIVLLDHIILSESNYFSFYDENLISH